LARVTDLGAGIDTLLVAAIVAALAPFVTALVPGRHLPQVVVLVLGGMLVGPQVLGLADPDTIVLLSNVGLGFLFLLAGYEIQPSIFREHAGRLALVGWGIAAALALAVVALLEVLGFVRAFVPVAIGLTTTALGVLLPILRDNNLLTDRFGKYVIAAGATGELLPIIAIALFLSTTNSFEALLSLLSIGGLALVLSLAPRLTRHRRVREIMAEGQGTTSQTALRWTIVLLFVLLAFAARFSLDIVLGAFLAGLVLRTWAPDHGRALSDKLDAVGYGFFIPLFFVTSGMGLDVHSILASPARLVVFFLLLVIVRGLPALLVYRRALATPERVQMVFITATALPLLVALSHIGLVNGTMLPENAAALVGAGVLSVIIFPAVAVALASRPSRTASTIDSSYES
jgi:Kef-type K+ transport system membrane component KefB